MYCLYCDGLGRDRISFELCLKCNGSGVFVPEPEPVKTPPKRKPRRASKVKRPKK